MILRPLVFLALAAAACRGAELAELWKERLRSVVAVEFLTENEQDRRTMVTYGLVLDDQGTIILHAGTIDPRVPPSRLKNFRIYVPGRSVNDYAEGTYLGSDAYTSWHYVRAADALRPELKPISSFAGPVGAEPRLGEDLWGIGLRSKDEDFEPYLLTGKVSLIRDTPQRTGFANDALSGPQLPIFSQEGTFVGIGVAGYGETFIQWSRNEPGTQVVLISPDEAGVFRLAREVLPHARRLPKSLVGRPLTWLGTHGLQPVGPEVARFLKLENQAALVVSEVLENSPAEKAGLQDRDILVGFEGRPLPRMKPDAVVAAWFDREIARREPGQTIKLSVLRGKERVEISAVLGDEPKVVREAEHTYFDRLGFTAREFLYGDAVNRRLKQSEAEGVVASFVKNNGSASTAGLRRDDWIREIDGVAVKTYAEAIEKLRAIENDKLRVETVLLTSRGGETSVIRVKLR